MEGGGQAELKQLAGKAVELWFEQVRLSHACMSAWSMIAAVPGPPRAQGGGQYTGGVMCPAAAPLPLLRGRVAATTMACQQAPPFCWTSNHAAKMLQEEEWRQGVVIESISKS